jgi:hypothetical protein
VVLSDISAAKRLFSERTKQPYRSGADALFVFDTESFYWTASLPKSDPVSNTLVDYAPLAGFRSGVVFDPIHLRDLEKVDLTQYRVVVFTNTFVLSDRQRDYIQRRVATDNRTVVWFYAPGYSDGTTLDDRRLSALTGMTIIPTTLQAPPHIVLESLADTVISFTTGDSPFGPLFAVSDSAAEVFGRYKETHQVAVARKVFGNHTSWYVALPGRNVEPLRSILRSSGAHVYANQGEIVYAGGGIVTLHTREGGRHSVTLRNGKSVDFDLPEGCHTLYLDSETGEPLLPQAQVLIK